MEAKQEQQIRERRGEGEDEEDEEEENREIDERLSLQHLRTSRSGGVATMTVGGETTNLSDDDEEEDDEKKSLLVREPEEEKEHVVVDAATKRELIELRHDLQQQREVNRGLEEELKKTQEKLKKVCHSLVLSNFAPLNNNSLSNRTPTPLPAFAPHSSKTTSCSANFSKA